MVLRIDLFRSMDVVEPIDLVYLTRLCSHYDGQDSAGASSVVFDHHLDGNWFQTFSFLLSVSGRGVGLYSKVSFALVLFVSN